ncbi:uncharacterized protein [Fopius arisanus]|uniref:Uncharacterized protein isoform X2 n=1 Tax=Fopius arisanus TaxID=64838 RepID=A0A9R1SUM1_9HYME|nr:PREDICTED: uncharacterized protein LOC105263128 isoform X2 [Fopius arisanus]
MLSNRVIVLLLIATCVRCHPTPGDSLEKLSDLQIPTNRLRRGSDQPDRVPFSPRRLEKMLEKAILKIITGDLSNSNLLLLKSLNYSLEEVLAIRQRELGRKSTLEPLENEKQILEGSKDILQPEDKLKETIDYDAFNRKAVEDYESIGNKMEEYTTPVNYDLITRRIGDNSNGGFHANFDRAMEPHVVFKIRYDDSDIDSSSIERSRESGLSEGMKILGTLSSSSRPDAEPQVQSNVEISAIEANEANEANETNETNEANKTKDSGFDNSGTNDSVKSSKKVSLYEGLEWVEDDVYRVIPEALNYELGNYEEENETMEAEYQSGNSSIEMTDDYFGYQEDKDLDNRTIGNFTAYQQLAVAHRRDQVQNAIEEIKMRVLAMTGRFNLTANNNQVQREKLTMFAPTCEAPKNTDLETWSDPFSMNMHFEMNLTSSDHIVAARLRIYKLPQGNSTSTSASSSGHDDEEEEKKIRISVYYYTKSLKKHRSKKRLMDSVVTPLTPGGGHLALDVRQALRFWRQPHPSNNHGILVQVEDQDGKPLKPALYVQQDSCHANDEDTDEKAYQRVPAIFLQACSRYVRVVNGEAVTYVNCKNLRNSQH